MNAADYKRVVQDLDHQLHTLAGYLACIRDDTAWGNTNGARVARAALTGASTHVENLRNAIVTRWYDDTTPSTTKGQREAAPGPVSGTGA